MAKKRRVEKSTRRFIERIADLIKEKGGKYKFRTKKKKQIKQIKKTCVHWTLTKKGQIEPVLVTDPDNPANWKCKICGAVFPVVPTTQEEVDAHFDWFMSYINQVQFYGVGMGGDKEDTNLLLQTKNLIPRVRKIGRNIIKQMEKKKEWEDRRSKTNKSSQFDGFGGFSYR
jgi:transcription elongation factor Elf1